VLTKLFKGIPVGRLGQASEIARPVQFLVDDDAGYITGSVISAAVPRDDPRAQGCPYQCTPGFLGSRAEVGLWSGRGLRHRRRVGAVAKGGSR
jgi:hypothetical protein